MELSGDNGEMPFDDVTLPPSMKDAVLKSDLLPRVFEGLNDRNLLFIESKDL
jgi:hypothetical protein